MKDKILKISDDLRSDKITEEEAKILLLVVFGEKRRYTLETYTPKLRQGYKWYILDNLTNTIIQNYKPNDINFAESKIYGLNKDQSNIAVISLDTKDFLNWKENNNLRGGGLQYRKKFKIGNNVYNCITKANDLCSLTVNDVIETEHAKENEEYDEIKMVIKGNLASN